MKIYFDSSCISIGYNKILKCEVSLLFLSFFWETRGLGDHQTPKERIESRRCPLSLGHVYPYFRWKILSKREKERETEKNKRGKKGRTYVRVLGLMPVSVLLVSRKYENIYFGKNLECQV